MLNNKRKTFLNTHLFFYVLISKENEYIFKNKNLFSCIFNLSSNRANLD